MLKEVLGCSIDLTKIDKTKIKDVVCKDGHTGKFIDVSILINDEQDKFNNICSLAMGKTKEEHEAKVPTVYLGNGKRVCVANATSQPASIEPQNESKPSDDLPF